MSRHAKPVRIMVMGACVIFTTGVAAAAASASGDGNAWAVDFRYAPAWWQTSICLPDDWQKTLVGQDGGLLYDYRGPHDGFKTKITAGMAGGTDWVRQQLHSPRVPIVRTVSRRRTIEVVTEAFAIAPRIGGDEAWPDRPIVIERIGNTTGLAGWAAPKIVCDPAFRNIAVGWKEAVSYRFHADKKSRYTVVFGLCEGHHTASGHRVLHLQIEGKTRHTVDMIKTKGRNVPAAFAFDARDENGDGWIDLAVSAAEASSDKNTILNALWVFEEGKAPPSDKLIAGPCPKSALGYVDCGGTTDASGPPRHDIVIARLVNKGKIGAIVVPSLTIQSELAVEANPAKRQVRIGSRTTLSTAGAFSAATQAAGTLVLHLRQVEIDPGKSRAVAFCIARGETAKPIPIKLAQAERYRDKAEQYWLKADLPYDRITVPDAGVQALVDASIRNIYQAREIKGGLPAFQVGPTCYRGLWVVDGSFLMEAVTFLGRIEEARNGIKYLLGFQRDDGGIMIIDGHWKETGITLWAVTRHARLTGDKSWLNGVWSNIERGVAYIRQMRKTASAKASAPNAGLIPDGFSDGGLGGKAAEYTNVYWTMAGMRSTVDAARWLGKTQQADDWQREYDDFCKTFRRAAQRDTRKDAHANRYVPIRMVGAEKVAPQRAQWAFLHAVFPGKVFPADDPLVRGNLAMLKAVECEGLVFGTGWLSKGIWNYFASFYGHAWLWTRQGQKASQILYAFANHASPMLAWREEQMPVGKGSKTCGDMPHNWASAEFIRLVRHLLVLERGDALHLFEGMPAKWARPNAVTKLKGIVTTFGPMSLELRVAGDGKIAQLHVDPPKRSRPARIVVHLDGWSGRTGLIDVSPAGPCDQRIELSPGAAK